MKIILVCLIHINELPPMMTAIKALSKKYNVIYIGSDECTEEFRLLFGDNVEFINVVNKTIASLENSPNKFLRAAYWKVYKQRKIHKIKKIVESKFADGDILWIHHEYTLMHMDKMNIPYYLTMYELHEDLFRKNSNLIQGIKAATKVIVPEYTRAAIVQAVAGLKDLPLIVQNKPYDYGEMEITTNDTTLMTELVSEAHKKGKMVILYSGIFLRERKLDTFIEAVNRLNDRFVIALMGRKSDYLDELLSKYSNVKYIGFFNPPKHLSVIKESDIGILTYVSDSGSINPVFCAPNKIWEYAKFGIPMICNDIPGLKFTVEYNGFGFCCNINSVEDICEKLINIYNNYDKLSEKASHYYETVDVENDILSIVEVTNK